MKQLLFAFFSAFFIGQLHAQVLTGNIIDAKSKQAIPYVNIGVVGKGVGTVSDMNGHFSINLFDSLNNETLRFSYIGYKSVSFKVSDVKRKFENQDLNLQLEENIFSLSQVVVKPKVYKTKILGNENNSKSMIAGFKSNDLGSEMGTIMHIKKSPTYLENVNFNIAKNEIANAKFRVNIYSIKNGLPDSILLNEPIYVTTSIPSGTLSVDLKKYNLWVTSDYLVSLEWIEDYGPNKLFFCIGLGNHNSLWRKTSQDAWQKANPIGIGFNSTVTYEK